MIRSLEGIRGLAAIFVTLHHFGVAWYFRPIEYGYLFVDLFFVLSGFVITATYSTRLNKFSDLKPFMIRRFGRLFPLMIFATVLFVFSFDLAIWVKHAVVAMGYSNIFKNPGALTYMVPSFTEAGGTALFAQGMGCFDSLILNYVSWSISVEFYTYLLFAALWVVLRGQTRWVICILLSIAGIAVTAWASLNLHDCIQKNNCYAVTYDFGFARCVGSFFLGALAFHISRVIKFNANTVQLGALGAVIAFFALVGTHPMLAFSFPVLCALLVVSICRDTGFLADLMQRKPFQILGQRSYSIYMLHPIILLFMGPVPTVINGITAPVKSAVFTAVGISIYLTIIIVVAGWSYAKIETPFRDWFGRVADKSKVSQRVALRDS